MKTILLSGLGRDGAIALVLVLVVAAETLARAAWTS